MVSVMLAGSPQTQWHINGRFLPGGTMVELTDEEIEKHKDVVLNEFLKEVKQSEKKKFSEKELLDLTKSEQVEILKNLKVEKIPTTEKERVKLILGVQDDSI